MCNKPITAYVLGTKENGKLDLTFSKPTRCEKVIEVPCGRCIACRLEKTRVWGLRAEHEAKFHNENCFITLTYDPKHLPPSLEKEPLQKFFKRLRKRIHPIKIKYIASGELGDNYDNPHYHLCVFGYIPDDCEHLYEKNDAKYYVSNTISKLWPFGFHTITALNFQTARYTAKYAIKKELGKKEKTRPAEFFVCSQGIGQTHVDNYAKGMAEKGSTYANGHSCALPRYYKEKIKLTEYNVTLCNKLDEIQKQCNNKYHHQKRTLKDNQNREIIQTAKLNKF